MAQEFITREINVGRITGLSSYELACKYGFVGTEEEYVNKETDIYNKMLAIAAIPGFRTITCNGVSIGSTIDASELTIESDNYVNVSINANTNTLRISLDPTVREKLDTITL